MFTQVKDTSSKPKDPSVAEISKAAVLPWDQCYPTRKGKQSVQANKISAIKHKGQQNPLFQQQQKQPQGQQPQQSTDAGAEKKKSRCGKKGKGKSQDHAHITSAAFFPTIIADMPTAIDPCLYAHQLPQLYQGQGGPAFDSRIKEAFSLADQLGVTPSCKIIRTLDACISAPIGETTLSLLNNGHDLEPFGYPPADLFPLAPLDVVMTDATSTSTYVEELPSEDEEVTQAPPADHWSEDDFVDIYGSVNGDIAEATGLEEDPWLVMIRSAPSASFAPQCSHSALSTYMRDGQVACSSTPAVSESFFMNVIACSCSDHVNHSKECACKHEDDGRMFWILDSGTSIHFTLHHLDFVDYVELRGDDHIPVQTAGGVIHVTGQGRMLIQWMDHVHKKSHLLDLHGIWHIPNSGVHLISLGQLLNHGAKVQGDMHQINVLYGDGILLAPFKPGHLGSNMYTLESLPLKGLTMTCMLTYNIVHCCLGHPSKDVICHAHKHTWNFSGVEIPNMDSICPGCTMGKLPNRSFPPSEHRTICAFELIHLDIKSFPTVSYHHYWYIITFVDDYMSMA